MHKMFTLDDLYDFYASQNTSCTFNSKSADSTIVVQVPERMTFSDEYDPQYALLKTHLMSCHLFKNQNKSSISEEAMNQAIPSFYNRPILGYIQEIEDKDGNVSYDFAGHEMIVGKDGEIEYEEIPVGVIPESCNAQLVYHEEYDKTYLEVDGLIYEDYTKAAEILRNQGECDVSIEIAVDALSYNAKEKTMNIDQFHFLGVTILGVTRDESHREIAPGMSHSNITLADFDKKNNSVFDNVDIINKIADAIVFRLSNKTEYSVDNTAQEGGKNPSMINELLSKYNKTIEDITFEYENLTDEELEAKFAEVFGSEDPEKKGFDDDATADGDGSEPTGDESGNGDSDGGDSGSGDSDKTDNEDDDDDKEANDNEESEANAVNDDKPGKKKKYSKVFEISHEDIRSSLYALLASYEQEDNEWYWISNVYDDHFVYEGFFSENNIYDQKYVKDGDNISFDGERIHLHRELLTDSEMASLTEMRNNYSLIETKLQKYESEPEKLEVFASEDYAIIRNSEEFVELREEKNHFDLSVDEVKNKLDEMLLTYAKAGKLEFASNNVNKYPAVKKLFNNSNKKSSRYGNLFANKK